MRFAVADLDYLNSLMLVTESSRKSVDGTKVLAHAEFVLSVAEKEKVKVYEVQSKEFKELLASPEWTKEEYATPEEIFGEEL